MFTVYSNRKIMWLSKEVNRLVIFYFNSNSSKSETLLNLNLRPSASFRELSVVFFFYSTDPSVQSGLIFSYSHIKQVGDGPLSLNIISSVAPNSRTTPLFKDQTMRLKTCVKRNITFESKANYIYYFLMV